MGQPIRYPRCEVGTRYIDRQRPKRCIGATRYTGLRASSFNGYFGLPAYSISPTKLLFSEAYQLRLDYQASKLLLFRWASRISKNPTYSTSQQKKWPFAFLLYRYVHPSIFPFVFFFSFYFSTFHFFRFSSMFCSLFFYFPF